VKEKERGWGGEAGGGKRERGTKRVLFDIKRKKHNKPLLKSSDKTRALFVCGQPFKKENERFFVPWQDNMTGAMRRLAAAILLVLGFGLEVGGAVEINITIGDTIDCLGLMPELLAGDAAALQFVLDACKADARCSEVTGQSKVERAALFDMILSTIDTVGPDATRSTLTPILLLVCGKTLDQVNELLWPVLIRMGMCDAKIACGFDKQPDDKLIDPDTGKVSCEQLPDRESSNAYALDTVTVVFGILLIMVMLIMVGLAWYGISVETQKLRMTQQIEARKQREAEAAAAASAGQR